MKTVAALYTETVEELSKLDGRRNELLVKLRTLQELGAAPGKKKGPGKAASAATWKKVTKKGKGRVRAPQGELERAIKDLLAGGEALPSRDVRARLEAAKYPYSLTRLYVGKTLGGMVRSKVLAIELDGTRRVYRLAK